MKFLRLKLTNYIGIYNGLGLNEIDIDFTKCKYKILIIKGKNGSGKSTINGALNLFPDSASNFIPNLPAEKLIDLYDNGIIYHIRFEHKVNKYNKRETSKSYISKQIGDSIVELNPNGNLSSYKDVLYSEFKLDSNFITLSQLSSDDKGLANKKPAERKKFVTSIISNLSVYNDINKCMAKRSSVFRSMINSLVAKIDLIGNKEKVKFNLKATEKILAELQEKKDNLIEIRSSNKTKVSMLDPNGNLQNIGKEILDGLVKLKEDEKIVDKNIDKLNIKNNSESEINDFYNKLKEDTISLKATISSYENNLNSLLLDRETEAKEINIKSEKINSLVNENRYKDLKEKMNESKEKLNSYKAIIDRIGIKDINSISKDEFILALEALYDIKELILDFLSNISRDKLKIGIDCVRNNDSLNFVQKMQNTKAKIELLKNDYTKLQIELQTYKNLYETSKKISLRPKNCKIDTCDFIKDALSALSKNPDKHIKDIEIKMDGISEELIKLNKEESDSEEINIIINALNRLIRTIDKNTAILNKLPINNLFNNKDILFERIYNNYEFSEIDELYEYIDYSNIIDEYKSEISIYNKFLNEYDLYKNKNILVESLTKDIDNTNKKLNDILDKIEKSNTDLLNKKKKLEMNTLLLSKMESLIKLFEDKKNIQLQKQDIINKYNTVKINLKAVQDCLNSITSINNSINLINNEIAPLIDEKEKLKQGLTLLTQYNKELEEYQLKYNKIELIKKYSSPSKGGIQTLFIKLYMNKTIALANQLLSYLFDGEYAIEKYIINENEFRIPVSGNGYVNDDISSMSGGETSMISMILSFVLLQQSSTKYNIPKLDEIDAPLDNDNRGQFPIVLNKLIDILDVEQCIMISHNEEIDLTNCDVIQLKSSKNENLYGNIIYKY